MKKYLFKILAYLQRVYRITLSYKKYESIVWNDLKKLHKKSSWRYGVYENDKHIETVFEIAEKTAGTFYYMVYDGQYHCRVKVLENFPPELTTEIFVLAAHFNNLLFNGAVIINVSSSYVEYHTRCDYIVNLIYPGELEALLLRHYNTSKDIYWAFDKLINENEEPSIIIGDLLRMNKKENENKDTSA